MKVELCAATLVLGMLASNPSLAGKPESFGYNGTSANATFFSSDSCTYTYAEIFAADEVSVGYPPDSGARVSIYKYDACAGVYLVDVFAGGTLPPEAFVVAQNRMSALLDFEVEVYNYATDTLVPLKMHLSWSVKGPLESTHYVGHYAGPGAPQTVRSTGKARQGTATGTVSAGAVDLQQSSENASIMAYGYINTTHVRKN